jgi:hypothetical protein
MSEYVEARYVRFVLQKAELAEHQLASQLINDLLRDLTSLQILSDAGAQTLTSIRLLALRLAHRQSLPIGEWDAAHRAAQVWCQSTDEEV